MTTVEDVNSTGVGKLASSVSSGNLKDQFFQNSKDRTLFCINIDQKCTEEILYELFLQAGPIENMVKKQDRNGKNICLITYKHLESCEYAIRLFNGISLYNQSLRVQFSQNSNNNNNSMNNRDSTGLNSRNSMSNLAEIQTNNYNNNMNNANNNPVKNRLSLDNANQQIQSMMQQSPGLMHLMMQSPLQQLIPLLNNGAMQQSPLVGGNSAQTPTFNRSKSGSNLPEFEHQNNSNNRVDRQNSYNYRNNNNNNNYNNNNNRGHHHHHHHHQNQHQSHNNNQHNYRQDMDYRQPHSDQSRNDSRRSHNRSRSRSPNNNKRHKR